MNERDSPTLCLDRMVGGRPGLQWRYQYSVSVSFQLHNLPSSTLFFKFPPKLPLGEFYLLVSTRSAEQILNIVILRFTRLDGDRDSGVKLE